MKSIPEATSTNVAPANATTRELVIRRAEFKDADAIAAIYWRARAEAMPWLPVIHSALETRGWVARVVLKEEDVYVATDAGKIVGFAGWRTLGRERRLTKLYVHPELQRRGVGSLLFATATRKMPDGFRFWVFQKNAAARAFYERRGCTLVREVDGWTNPEREPDAEYAWRR